jgi:branched-chain amino acid transport system substrate-binding protein
MRRFRVLPIAAFAASLMLGAGMAAAQKKYDTGATDTEIKIGQTMPYSGPASAYGVIGKAEVAYFEGLNQKGGINGRKVTLMSLDDGYAPPKAVEQTRRLVEQEGVLAIVNGLGTANQSAVQQYLNGKKVPQLFVASGATKWGDPEHFPWTIGWQPSYQTEARIYAKFILANYPSAKIAVLYQNDDYGKDYLKGLQDGLGDKAKTMIVKEVSFETSDPTVDSQIITLQASGADVFFNVATPKWAAQAIRKAAEIGWKPVHILNNVSASIGSVLKPAGFENSLGIITAEYRKDPVDPQFMNEPAMQQYAAWLKERLPGADISDNGYLYGYMVAQTTEQLLKQCGDDLTHANLMKQAASLNLDLPLLQPGLKVSTSPTNFFPIRGMRLQKFDGKTWVPFGEAISS